MANYAIGLDFGTLSARAIAVDVKTGKEAAISVYGYQDMVIDACLPGTNIEVPLGSALQNPQDYVEALEGLLKDIVTDKGIAPNEVVGIGVAFTSCTLLSLDENFHPLCFDDRFRNNPHSWAKLWKHHSTQKYAQELHRTAMMRNEDFLARCGKKVSEEGMYAKILETLVEAPDVYKMTHRFMEGGDWIVYLLTGNECINNCAASFKGYWTKSTGYPPNEFFKAIDIRLDGMPERKLSGNVRPVGSTAGGLTEEMAERTGLKPDTPVAVANVDAHISVPAVGVTATDKIVMIMGTSLCHMLVSEKEVPVPGICGVVKDGIIPGLYGYEAGQSAAGDIYDWFVSNYISYEYEREALDRDMFIFDLMNEKAAKIKPGESGLLTLDWLNGNRSVLVNGNLSGMILGLRLSTRPEEIYRALIEGTAFGSRLIIETYLNNGIDVDEIYACGGMVRKSQTVMQIFADVLGRPITISDARQTSALGAAMYGAVAAKKKGGGYDSIFEAAPQMSKIREEKVMPDMKNHNIYTRLFEEYKKLYDYFGRNGNHVMEVLKNIQESVAD